MESKLIHQSLEFTARLVGDSGDSGDAAWTVISAVEKAMHNRKLPGHLFVTIVASGLMVDEEGRPGLGLYHSGIQHLAVCVLMPEDFPGSHDEWLEEVRVSTIHEIVHYEQDLAGKMGPDEDLDAIESEAEVIAHQIASMEA
ncbi:MAG: hypothetical protein AAGB04_00335 [Pseudomonadota bacterium]